MNNSSARASRVSAKECMQKWRVQGEPHITITEAKQIYHLMDLNEYQFVVQACNYMHNLFDHGTMISRQGITETDTSEQLQAIFVCESLNVLMIIPKQDISEMQKSVSKIMLELGSLNRTALIIFNDTSEEVGVTSVVGGGKGYAAPGTAASTALAGHSPPPEVRGKPKLSESSGLSGSTNGMIAARVNTGIYERYIPLYQYIPQYIPRYIPAAAAVYTTVYTIAAAVYTTVYTIAAVYTSADKFEF